MSSLDRHLTEIEPGMPTNVKISSRVDTRHLHNRLLLTGSYGMATACDPDPHRLHISVRVPCNTALPVSARGSTVCRLTAVQESRHISCVSASSFGIITGRWHVG